MQLKPLASPADLQARGVDTSDATRVHTALNAVSASIRDAARCPISLTTATVRVTPDGCDLNLLGPILAIETVTVAGTPLTGWVETEYGITSHRRWGPGPVHVTYTFGLSPVPADIVDLTCNLATAWLNHVAEGGGSTAGLTQVRLDDASESYTEEAAGQVSPAFLPTATRDWIASRFGGGVTIVGTR